MNKTDKIIKEFRELTKGWSGPNADSLREGFEAFLKEKLEESYQEGYKEGLDDGESE